MELEIPSKFKLVYSAEQIAEANKRLGAEITAWAHTVWARSHTDLMTIPVLRGGIFFFADLVRSISASVELFPTSASSYVGTEQQHGVKVSLDDIPARGRSVLLVDEICDSGKTFKVLSAALKERGAFEVKKEALVTRKIPNPAHVPDWIGFEYDGPEWLVGYGMDDADRWRNLDSVYMLRQG